MTPSICCILLTMKGIIDIHTHGMKGLDTRTSDSADVIRLSMLWGKSGTSAVLPTIYAAPIERMRENIKAVYEAMHLQQGPKCRGARILGVHIEGPFLNPLRSGALDKGSFALPTVAGIKKLIAGFEDIVKIITVSPELKGSLGVIEWCAKRGIRVSLGHSDATYKQALRAKQAGATAITHIFNAMRPMHHREPGLAGFGLIDPDMYVEVIADGIHLSAEALMLIFKCKPPERIILVSDSVKGPMRVSGVLQGGQAALGGAYGVLSGIGIAKRNIRMACRDNPRRYLGI